MVQPPKAEIPPKSKIDLPVEMRTSGKSGEVAEHIRVQLDGDEWEVFVLKGRVDPTHVAVLDLGQFRRGDAVRQAFEPVWGNTDPSMDNSEIRAAQIGAYIGDSGPLHCESCETGCKRNYPDGAPWNVI